MKNEISKDAPLTAAECVAAIAAIIWTILFGVVLTIMAGCRHISIEKHDPIPYPSATNAVEWIDGGYDFSYWNWGFKTDVDSIRADKTRDGVEIVIGKIGTDVSERHAEIVGATGTAVGNVAQKIIDGVKGVETIKTGN